MIKVGSTRINSNHTKDRVKREEKKQESGPSLSTAPKVETRTCHHCGKVGHIKPNCPELKSVKRNLAHTSLKQWNGRLNELPVGILLDRCASVSCVSDTLKISTADWYPSK